MSQIPTEPDGWLNTLETALEHGSHAWAALLRDGIAHVRDEKRLTWPPECADPPGSAAYHVAAVLGYVWLAFNGISERYPTLDESTEGGIDAGI